MVGKLIISNTGFNRMFDVRALSFSINAYLNSIGQSPITDSPHSRIAFHKSFIQALLLDKPLNFPTMRFHEISVLVHAEKFCELSNGFDWKVRFAKIKYEVPMPTFEVEQFPHARPQHFEKRCSAPNRGESFACQANVR